MAELTENLIKMGRELGYSGEQLQTFVKEEKAEIRQREKEQREREREEKEREREREREREEKEREREERRLNREAEEQERQAQLQLAKINAEIEISRANKSTTKNASHEFLSKVPKMNFFTKKSTKNCNLVSSLTKARETQYSLYPCWQKDVLRCKKIFISVLLIILKPLTK